MRSDNCRQASESRYFFANRSDLFYASNGVELDNVEVKERRLEVRIRERSGFKYTTRFIGTGGRILAETGENPAVFELSSPEIYVRAVVEDSGGWKAWVQPAFVVVEERDPSPQ